MKTIVKLVILTATILFIAGCGGSSDPGELSIEKVKGGKLIADVPANIIKADLIKKGLAENNTTVFGFKAYKIPYTTTDEENNIVQASGVMVVPTGYNASDADKQKLTIMKSIGLAMVVNCHGTIFANAEAPSVEIENSALPDSIGIIFSSISGFVTLQPDYIGYGDSKGHYHPYLLEKSSANSVVDFIKAAIKFAQDNNIPIVASKDLYLTGYSQGGYVALAAQEKLEQEGSFNLKLSIPMDGPYLLDPIAAGVLQSDTLGVPSFMAAVAYSYSKAYKRDITELVQEPYASKLSTLFNGSLTRVEIDKQLTHKTKGDGGLFTDSIATNYANSWFRAKLVENSVVDFRPQAPIKMLHCLGDDVIPYQVAQGALQGFTQVIGASNVSLIPIEPTYTKDANTQLRLGHAECAAPAYKIAASIFATTREQTIGY